MFMYRAGFMGQKRQGGFFGHEAAKGTGSEAKGDKFIWGRVLSRWGISRYNSKYQHIGCW